MKYGILTHTKIKNTHKFYLDIDTSDYDFLIETSFIATASYIEKDDIMFNDQPYECIIVPDRTEMFSNGDCVYCIIDMFNQKLIISDIRKGAADSLIVFNNFSLNPETSFGTNRLFSKDITISDSKEYSDLLVGCCVVLENTMVEDGNAPLTMMIQVSITGQDSYVYNIDITRKHEVLNFDHMFKNVQTNIPLSVTLTYSYNTYIYGSSYTSPTIKNNNVTVYLQGTNIITADSTDLYNIYLGRSNYIKRTHAIVSGIKDYNLTAYRFPDIYIDPQTKKEYPVEEIDCSGSLYNCKYISFGKYTKIIKMNSFYFSNPYYVYSYGANTGNLSLFENTMFTLILPDNGICYIYGKDGNDSGYLYNNNKHIKINGDPDHMLMIYYYWIYGNCLPYKQYPDVTIQDTFLFLNYYGYYHNFSNANKINIISDYVVGLYYNNCPYNNSFSSSYYGLNALQYPDDHPSLQLAVPSNNIEINIKCKIFNNYYMMEYFYPFICNLDKNEYELYDKYKEQGLSYKIFRNTITFNITGDVITENSYSLYVSEYKYLKRDIWFYPCINSYSDKDTNNIADESFEYNRANTNTSNILSYMYSSGSSFIGNCDGEGNYGLILPIVNVNIKGNCYSCFYDYSSYILYNINIDGDLYSVPYTSNNKSIYSFSGPSYMSDRIFKFDNEYLYNSYTISGSYDLSKRMVYRYIKNLTQRKYFYYDINGNTITKVNELSLSNPKEPDFPTVSISALSDYYVNILEFNVHKLEGIVNIPCNTTYSNSFYIAKFENNSWNYDCIYTYNAAKLNFDEIAPNTIITNFGFQNLKLLNINLSKLSVIGKMEYCNITRIELPTPIVAFTNELINFYYDRKYPSSSSYYNIYYQGSSKEDLSYDYDNWNDPNDNSYYENSYVEFNVVCLGNIFLKWKKMSEEEVLNDKYIQDRYEPAFNTTDEVNELKEQGELDIDGLNNGAFNYRYGEREYYRVVLPKNENIKDKIDDFIFDRDSYFTFRGSYKIENDELKIYPEIKLFDVTRFIGKDFLNGYYYSVQQSGNIIKLPENLEFYGRNAFNYNFVELIGEHTYTLYCNKNSTIGYYFTGYDNQLEYKASIENAEDTMYNKYPIKEVKVGKYLESLINNIFPFADRVTIDPSNPNFVIENGYIYNADKTILFRPVCYSEQLEYDPNEELRIVSNTLTTIVDNKSFKNDVRIRSIEISSKSLEIYQNLEANLYMPDNITKIVLPSGKYTILDSDFDKMEYIDFLNITSTSKYYVIPESEAGDVYTNFSKQLYYYTNSAGMYSYNKVEKYGITYAGSRLIYAKNPEYIKLPDACKEIGGKLHIGTIEISSTRNTNFNISNPNIKINNYTVNEDGSSYFFTTKDNNDTNMLWLKFGATATTKFLIKYPTGVENDEVIINLNNNEYIDCQAFKYCNIKKLVINVLETRKKFIFAIANNIGSSYVNFTSEIPYGFYNDYNNTYVIEEDDITNIIQHGVTYYDTFYGQNNRSNYAFNQTHYHDNNFCYADGDAYYNKLVLPVLNNTIEEFHLNDNPNYIFMGPQNLYKKYLVISPPVRASEYWVTGSNNVSTYMYYSGGSTNYIINEFTLPKVNKLYIDYDYNEIMSCYFPIDDRYNEIHFLDSLTDTLKYINKLVVCGPDTKIYPENLLDNLTSHNYELYYNTNTNLEVSSTEFNNVTFGERCGTPFKSNTTITLNSCFVHSCFVHPTKCENIDLILSDDTKFGYCTALDTRSSLVGERFSIFNQYADYARTYNSSNYSIGNQNKYNQYFFLFSPALSLNKYMYTLFKVFKTITTPRLFSYMICGDISSLSNKYKLFDGSFYNITMPIQYIPYCCFYSIRTDGITNSGYTLFTYEQFKTILETLTGVDLYNRFEIPVNPDGETHYSFIPEFTAWVGCQTSSQQKYIDSWEINSAMTDYFINKNELLYFIRNLIINTNTVCYYAYTSSDVSTLNYSNFVKQQTNTITINSENPIIDIGVFPYNNTKNERTSQHTTYVNNKFELVFTDKVKTVKINQLIFPGYYYTDADNRMEVLDFSKYKDIQFIIGTSSNLFQYFSNTYYYYRMVKISGFKKVILDDNITYTNDLPHILFNYANISEIVFNGSTVNSGIYYSSVDCDIFFGEKIKDVCSHFRGGNEGKIYINNFENVERISRWEDDLSSCTLYNSMAGCFQAIYFTKTSFDSLVNIGNNGGFYYCYFNDVAEFPKLEYAGINSFYGTKFKSLIAPLLTTIKAYSFYSCELTSINIPLVTTIEQYAFYDCPIEDSLTLESVEVIEGYAFNSTKITELHIPNATLIKANSFYKCTNIVKVFLPQDCVVEASAFYNTTILIRE